MNNSFKNILVVLGALILGGMLMFGIESLSHLAFPPPADLDTNDMEALKRYMKNVPAGSLALVLIAHASGALFSGWIISHFAASNHRMLILVTGLIWTFSGVLNIIMIPHPLWFSTADACIYLPMTILGSRILSKEIK